MRMRLNPLRKQLQKLSASSAAPIALCGIAFALLAVLTPVLSSRAGDDDSEAGARGAAAVARDAAPPSKTEIETLIRELGSPRFTSRRAAANELRRIGPDAFDALFFATEDSDPEVAASAHYLLRQIPVRWLNNEDSATVRRILRNYSESPDSLRQSVVFELALLPNREGLAALCRIARYDRSPLLSRKAALAVIWPDLPSARRTPVDPDVLERELGHSTRTAAAWLRQFQAQLRDPAAAQPAWQRLIEEESARIEQNSEETSAEVLVGLMWNLADIFRRLDNQPALTQVVDRILRLESDDPEQVAVALLMWLVEEKSWASVDDLLNRHRDRFATGKRPLYAAAIARSQQGRDDVAEEFAEQASKLDAAEPLESFEIAKDLELRDQYEWAAREYRRSIDGQPVESHESFVARVSLASMLHDHQADKEAAEILAPLVKVLGDPKVVRLYDQVRFVMADQYKIGMPERKSLVAQYHYYLACQHRAVKDWQREREALDTAIRADSEDADVLIAMFRVPEADEKWRADVRKKIADLARTFQQEIDAAPNVPHAYNQWAWLISNTEGDFQKAIEYSQKSLELNTAGESASASYLDTLGRCYYAAGDYESAVKFQRQAVEKVAYLQIMQRQLALFEKALAEQESSDKQFQSAN